MLSAVSLFLGGALAYVTPPGWQRRPAASAMRVAEFALPRDGDAEVRAG